MARRKNPPKQGKQKTQRAGHGHGDWRRQDPDYAAERRKYADPVPSRSYILQVLDEDGPLSFEELVERFGLTEPAQRDALQVRLQAMLRDGQVLRNRRGAFGRASRMNLIAGRVSAHRDGFGFVIPDDGGPDLFLPPRQMESLMSGDRVLVRPVPGRGGKLEAEVVEVLERANRTVAGRLVGEYGVHRVIPANPNLVHEILIPPQDLGGARDGQMVVAEIVTPPGRRTLPVGRIIEVLGDHLAPGMEIETAIRAFGLPHEWPDAVVRETEAIPSRVRPRDKQGREDLRKLPLVTIDGADARDFDDAVYAEPVDDGWRLIVAIADVSHYVKPGSALDHEACARGNSVYFPDHVLPMLPEKLSNGLCSLNPRVDRLCMACEMRVGRDGVVRKARFFEGVMRSHARLIYDEVAAALEGEPDAVPRRLRPLMPHLRDLHAVYEALLAQRKRRGAIELDSVETRIEFGPGRKIERIVPVQRNVAHRMIEECMIAANVEAAKFVLRHRVPALYRVHEQPDPEKIAVLRELLAARGVTLGGGEQPQPRHIARAVELACRRGACQAVQMAVLRAMMQARYSPEPLGHYGLALEHYAHFTSPIRRYPDLLLHRAIRHILRRKPADAFPYDTERMQALGDHCSMTERRADEAVRDVVNWLKCEFMEEHVGEVFDGEVTGVASFGLFVTLDGLYVDGLVHVSTLLRDYYEYDAVHQRLVGTRNGRVFSLGDRIRVRVVRVSLDERKIDLEPADRDVQPAFTGAGEDGQGAGSGARAVRNRARGRPRDSKRKSRRDR